MNKTIKTLLIYILPLIIGIVFAIIIWSLEFSGRKEYTKTFFEVGPDSLTNHFPGSKAIDKAIYSTVAPHDKKDIGGGFVIATIENNPAIKEFAENLKLTGIQDKIEEGTIFNIDLNYKERVYDIQNLTNNSKYPFPNFIQNENFKSFNIIYYDFGLGEFLPKSRIKENEHLDENWRHGYTRGIIENEIGEYKLWLIIW